MYDSSSLNDKKKKKKREREITMQKSDIPVLYNDRGKNHH